MQRFVERMRERGDLYESTYSGLYCTACEAFYTEDDLIDGRCPEHGTVPEFTEEQNTFFRLSAYADALLARYAADPPFVLPQTRLNEVRSFVEGGLQDVSITREAVNWGVPLPWDPDQAIYVWIDALINYTSALTYARPGEDLTERLWPARWQLLGKDILRFHAVIWPAMLLSAGYELPQQLFIHGMLAGQDGHRMSKTRGNAMDYRPAVELYGPDALRYYLLREVAFGQDGGVGYAGHARPLPRRARQRARQPRLAQRSRWSTRYRGGRDPGGRPGAPSWRRCRREVAAAYDHRFDLLDFTGALEHVWELVRALNRFVEARAPWELAKSDEPGGRGRARRDAGDAGRGRARARRPAVAVPARSRPAHARGRRRGGRRRRLRPGRDRQRQRPDGRRVGRAALPARRRASRRDRHPRAPAGPRGRRGRGHRGGRRGGRRADRLRRRLAGARRGGDRPARARTPGSSRRSGCTRTAPRRGTSRAREPRSRCSTTRGRGRRRVRPRLLPRPRAARARRRRPSRARSCSPRSTGKPLVIHTREAADDTLAVLRRRPHRRDPALLLAAGAPRRGRRARLVRVVRRQRHLPSASDARRGRAARAGRAAAARDRLPVPLARAAPRQAEPPALRARHAARRSRRCAASTPASWARRSRRTPRASSPSAMNAPRQVTLARLAELGLRPDRELGQHFLVDDNVLGVIERLAELRARRRRARGRRGRRHADRAPRRALRARARGRDRPPPRAGARRARWTATRT